MAITTDGKIPYVGFKALVRMFTDDDAPHALYTAYGTGTTAVTYYDYRMENESKRELADAITRSSYYLILSTTFVIVTETITPSEVGVFTAAYGGKMVFHAVISAGNRVELTADVDQFKAYVQIEVNQG